MEDLHLDLKEITQQYKVSRSTVLRWKRNGKFREEDIISIDVGKGTTKYLYSSGAIERILAENGSVSRATSTSSKSTGSVVDPGEYSISRDFIEYLKEEIEVLKEENAQLKDQVKLLESAPQAPKEPQQYNTPQPQETASEPVNKNGSKSFDWGWFTVFLIGILLLGFVYYIETAY